jgi:hypothetical protein
VCGLRGRPGLADLSERAPQDAIVEVEPGLHGIAHHGTDPRDSALEPSPENETQRVGETEPQASRFRPGCLIVEQAQNGTSGAEPETQDAAFAWAERAKRIDAVGCRRVDDAERGG